MGYLTLSKTENDACIPGRHYDILQRNDVLLGARCTNPLVFKKSRLSTGAKNMHLFARNFNCLEHFIHLGRLEIAEATT